MATDGEIDGENFFPTSRKFCYTAGPPSMYSTLLLWESGNGWEHVQDDCSDRTPCHVVWKEKRCSRRVWTLKRFVMVDEKTMLNIGDMSLASVSCYREGPLVRGLAAIPSMLGRRETCRFRISRRSDESTTMSRR